MLPSALLPAFRVWVLGTEDSFSYREKKTLFVVQTPCLRVLEKEGSYSHRQPGYIQKVLEVRELSRPKIDPYPAAPLSDL